MNVTEIVIVAATAIFVKNLLDRTRRNEKAIKEVIEYLSDDDSIESLIDSVNWNSNFN